MMKIVGAKFFCAKNFHHKIQTIKKIPQQPAMPRKATNNAISSVDDEITSIDAAGGWEDNNNHRKKRIVKPVRQAKHNNTGNNKNDSNANDEDIKPSNQSSRATDHYEVDEEDDYTDGTSGHSSSRHSSKYYEKMQLPNASKRYKKTAGNNRGGANSNKLEAEPFYFKTRREKLNWRLLNQIDIEKLMDEVSSYL